MNPKLQVCHARVYVIQGRCRTHRRFTKRAALRVYAWERLKIAGRIERAEPEVGYEGNFEDMTKIVGRFVRFWVKRSPMGEVQHA